ncbi:MAG TPA: tetratricopeptide repeat protein [Polyangiaceae bacterium]|nr:tetratricopeptide repeat protein [Polyangiaceae bacterium]
MQARTTTLALIATLFFAVDAGGASSSDELVLQARAHEAAHEEDVAVRRYTEALALDPTNGDAWAGLGDLRLRLGDLLEAERVFSAALAHRPSFGRALRGRARARWMLGRHDEAETDLERFAFEERDAGAYRELASWFAADGRTPAQLAIWRTLLAMAAGAGDSESLKEARRMVRALVILVDGADPASSPIDPGDTRRALARIARRAL